MERYNTLSNSDESVTSPLWHRHGRRLSATLAQSAEQRIRNAQVVGSIPTGGSTDYRMLDAGTWAPEA
jgi:hypothetical protein